MGERVSQPGRVVALRRPRPVEGRNTFEASRASGKRVAPLYAALVVAARQPYQTIGIWSRNRQRLWTGQNGRTRPVPKLGIRSRQGDLIQRKFGLALSTSVQSGSPAGRGDVVIGRASRPHFPAIHLTVHIPSTGSCPKNS